MLFQKYILSIFFLAFAHITFAAPLVFEFSGVISNTVVVAGNNYSPPSTHPEWNGETVTGRLIFSDLPESAKTPDSTYYYVEYGATGDQEPFASWMSFIINNPDGTVLDISDSVPAPIELWGEMDSAWTAISTSYFGTYRQYQNIFGYPRKSAYIGLGATGENEGLLTTGVDHYSTLIKPEFANYENFGSVLYHTEGAISYEYMFRIESFKRLTSSVPEPSVILLILIGLLALTFKRSAFRA